MLFVFVSKKLRWNAVKEFSLIFFFAEAVCYEL